MKHICSVSDKVKLGPKMPEAITSFGKLQKSTVA